ncbi:hypothetical protein [Pelagibaculum spongiae]|uniref:Uncharacterized protein n=1 Tax=Pelagibaculum spongiae TaxID=2080658 RepID=A0A2V1GW09_9GAMM|nr:hypothetical protein [Pelagibaculum spongiae]PVZ70210.1 hypothetical protein DC094_06295 [Pelagibaculum spongiae]
MKDQQKLCKILWRFDGGLLAQSVNNLDIDKMWFGYHGDAVDYDYCVETMETEAFFVDNNIDVSNIKIPKAMQQIFEDNLPQYLEQFSRSTLYKIHGEERAKAHFINILKWYIKKIDTISIQWVLFSIVPHFGIDQILSDYLKWKGCRVFYVMQTLFPNLLRIYEDYNADLYPIRFPPKELILPMPDCEAEEMFYMKKNKKRNGEISQIVLNGFVSG